MVECVTFEEVSQCISSSENEIEIVDVVPSHNSVTIFQKDNLQLDCINESCLEDPTNNVLNIVLPLVNKNVPFDSHPNVFGYDESIQNESCVASSNNHVQYSSECYEDLSLCVNKNKTSRNHSLPEDSELNRFSSTFENIKTLLKEGLVDGLDEMPPDFQPPNPPLLYRVSSLPNLSHNSTKNHHSCSYLTMCATKHELFLNKLCRNIVAKHDMSVQVSTELFKNQNEKILVDTSCQTEDIFVNIQGNNNVLSPKNDQNICNIVNDFINKEHDIKANNKIEIKTNKEEDCPSIEYTNINVFNNDNNVKTIVDMDCSSIDYTNINVFDKDHETQTEEEEVCNSVAYTNINVLSNNQEVNANVDECNSYININVFNKEHELKTNTKEKCCANVSYTKINTFDKEHKIIHNDEYRADIDYTNMNDVDNGNEICVSKKNSPNTNYTNVNMFDKKIDVETDGEDCVDIGYTNFSLYDKGLEINSNEDCENYANANILEEFVNEQLSLNNVDGDFDSFLFGPLPPSPIEEIGKFLK